MAGSVGSALVFGSSDQKGGPATETVVEDRLEIDWKATGNRPGIERKSTGNRSTIDRESIENRPEIDRKSVGNRPQIDRKSTANRLGIRPENLAGCAWQQGNF